MIYQLTISHDGPDPPAKAALVAALHEAAGQLQHMSSVAAAHSMRFFTADELHVQHGVIALGDQQLILLSLKEQEARALSNTVGMFREALPDLLNQGDTLGDAHGKLIVAIERQEAEAR